MNNIEKGHPKEKGEGNIRNTISREIFECKSLAEVDLNKIFLSSYLYESPNHPAFPPAAVDKKE
jgi:hypothetical protein